MGWLRIMARGAAVMSIMMCAATVWAMDRPSPEAVLIGNFGMDSGSGDPRVGDVYAGGGAVRAVETGEALFSRSVSDRASRLPSPLGEWTAIDHGDGLVSLYGRLEGGRTSRLPPVVEKGAIVGSAGATGWSEVEGFYYSLFDRKERRWVNPAVIEGPRNDRRAPVIQSVTLRDAQGRVIDASQAKGLLQGRRTVFVATADYAEIGEASLAPFRVVCSLNGREVGAVALEALSARDGRMWIYRNGLVPVEQVYAGALGFELGEVVFIRGQADLEILVQDSDGNVQRAEHHFIVE
ncbi:MAG: M23 family metallopeptidase [Treponema sp.]|nr:M23 family metallopeptidase [Treponema sp.]